MEFEWDLTKNVDNIAHHGIDFEDARRIFDGPVLERVDDRFDYGEERAIAIGIVDGRELYVVYTMREERCRIISARRVTRHEREAYYQALGG
ncbi:MAG: BrnT family toxin [Candidatus Tectomicrobia bacterium]|nr:BrnT family toxin [Candidatus Tectomicrobia bacterium]